MKTLTLNEVKALCEWAIENHSNNWGGWNNYPLTGCSYLQFEDNPLVVKFDDIAEFAGEKFKRIGWNRRIPGREPVITFSLLLSELKKAGITFGSYPEKRFVKIVEGKEISYLIKQSQFADYPCPNVCILDNEGNIIRQSITTASKYYPHEMI